MNEWLEDVAADDAGGTEKADPDEADYGDEA